MKMSKVGNQTNSQDPQAVNSRVFVGNLNTFQCSKTDVERMFQRYGRLAGISMHKGYAFVQFTNPFDARNACVGEDGRTVLGQILDVNMVAEPKPHQTGRKRQNVTLTDNDWDYYYDSYYASTVGFSTGSAVSATHLVVPSVKRQRLSSSSSRAMKNGTKVNGNNNNNGTNYVIPHIPENSLKVYSNPDILICGNCREMFTDLKEIINHKKTYCKLRFTCRCHTMDARDPNDKVTNGSDTSLLCSHCKDPFPNAWDLMVHIQATHMINIYELGVPYSDDKEDSSGRSNTSSPINSQHEKTNEDQHTNDNERQNGNCKQNGDSTNDSVMTEIFSNNGQNGNGLLMNDDTILDRTNHLPNTTIIADSQTLSSVLLTNGKK
ncbi:uncharacterized protein LOC123294793 [Chrysoperla carnea]|uniref:uncharacterized protein LOC123294793 n=1 Tax=Chrysoperla carnea TaxID=189513 RepID=UPI001D05F5BF|nr:uncharacterized protein LOC123294793 [Chrysoperla carnea]